MKICVVNYSNPVNTTIEYDSYVDYRDGVFWNEDRLLKKCTSWHSLAACLESEFFVVDKPSFEGCFKYDTIILLIHRDLDKVIPFVEKLKLMKKRILISFHENVDELSNLSMDLNWLYNFVLLCNKCDVFLNMNSSYDNFFEDLLNIKVERIHHAAPFSWEHNLVKDFSTREGIIIGTRTFNQRLRRNTLLSLVLCNEVAKINNTFVTLLSEDKIPQEYFVQIGLTNVKVEHGPLEYKAWLNLISKHKIMVHFDQSNTLGQVVSDAALVGVPCIGGNSENNIVMGTRCNNFEYFKLDVQRWYNSDEKIHQYAIEDLKEFTSFEAVKKEILKIVEKL